MNDRLVFKLVYQMRQKKLSPIFQIKVECWSSVTEHNIVECFPLVIKAQRREKDIGLSLNLTISERLTPWSANCILFTAAFTLQMIKGFLKKVCLLLLAFFLLFVIIEKKHRSKQNVTLYKYNFPGGNIYTRRVRHSLFDLRQMCQKFVSSVH